MTRAPFPSVTIAGGLLTADLLPRVLDDRSLPGRDATSYGLGGESVRERATHEFERLRTAWRDAVRSNLPIHQRWYAPLFQALGFGVLGRSGGITVDDRTFPVTHLRDALPLHLLPWGTDLDRRSKGVTEAARAAPQSMIQELLNRSDPHLWAVVSNGRRLRLLRDSRSLSGSAYVEFDLELIFEEGLFSDFVLLYRLVHASRFVPKTHDPRTCWIEEWRQDAVQAGVRAVAHLRIGVAEAIDLLGTGFAAHPANQDLRERLGSGRLRLEDYNRAVLRLVYRLLFWFVVEDRDVLHDPRAPTTARARYDRYFSAARLRERARRSPDAHHDLWEGVRLVFTALGEDDGRPELALPGLGGLFTRRGPTAAGGPSRPDELDDPIEGASLANAALLAAVDRLGVLSADGLRRAIDFRNLDTEELGSVYESLLELRPHYDPAGPEFRLRAAAGNERKATGSYYTPASLTDALLDSALDPVLDAAEKDAADDAAAERALLAVTVCDPACGSGHFLVSAARRIARRVAIRRSGEDEPSPKEMRTVMREVVSRCVHGVDLNAMALELAKVSLWMESIEPGRPLAVLDANLRVGNALLGTTAALVADGVPDDAVATLAGDDRAVVTSIRAQNRSERQGHVSLYGAGSPDAAVDLVGPTRDVVDSVPNDLTAARDARVRLEALDAERARARRGPDAWCAAFVQTRTPNTRLAAITHDVVARIAAGHGIDDETTRVEALAREYRFFHWELEFPHVFTGDEPGFSCVLGNPPWERVKLQEKEWFAVRDTAIAGAVNAAARKKAITALATSEEPTDVALHVTWIAAQHHAEAETHLLAKAGRHPLTGRGDINTYSVFAETARRMIAPHGRVGMVLPTGIATDATTQYFFADLVATRTLSSLFDFENEKKIFPGVHNQFRFCLWTAGGLGDPQAAIALAFRLQQIGELAERRFVLTPDDIRLMNPNTLTCPVFDDRRNADVAVGVYRRVPVLRNLRDDANPWGLSFLRMFDMANDSGLFRSAEEIEQQGWDRVGNVYLRGDDEILQPLYEAKMLHHFDHRFATYDGATQAQLNKGTLPRTSGAAKDDPSFTVEPENWVAGDQVEVRLGGTKRRPAWTHEWLLGWRDICRSSDVRTAIPSVFPRSGIGHTFPVALVRAKRSACLYANLSAFVLDFVVRQKIAGTHLTYSYFMQLPVVEPTRYDGPVSWADGGVLDAWVTARVLELTYTTWDLAGFARDHGDHGPPFRFDEERRFALRAELDAAYFHLYGLGRDEVEHVMSTFRAFRNTAPELFARTTAAILDRYDAMADAIAGAASYRTLLDPKPGLGPRHPA